MNTQAMTPQQIRAAGLEAFSRKPGVAGMIRFLQQFEIGQGDYSKDRHQWLAQYDAADIARIANEKRVRKNKRQG
jgi:hypothetical protein